MNPYIGYASGGEGGARRRSSTGKPIREVVLEQGLLPADELDRILDPRAMTEPGIPGKGFTPTGGGG